MRCLTLADRMTALGWRCRLMTDAVALETVPRLARSGHDVILSEASLASADLVVVDDYRLDASDEGGMRRWARRVLVVDDLADRRHDADLLVDQTLGRLEVAYRDLVPGHCRILAGASYVLVRPEFQRMRRRGLMRRQASVSLDRVLISLGATDPTGLTPLVLDVVARVLPDAAIDVVLGRSATSLRRVREMAQYLAERVTVHVDSDRMAALMAEADLAVGAAGSTAWERCALGLPTVTLVVADNQRLVARNLTAAGAVVTAGPENLETVLRGLTPEGLTTMSAAAAAVCDGRGAQRVLCAVAGEMSLGDGGVVSLCLVEEGDALTILDWQRHPETRRFARNPEIPTEAAHRKWFAGKLADPDAVFCLILVDGRPSGVLRLDRRDDVTMSQESPSYEVSIFTAPDQYGRGIGRAALALADRLAPGALLIAEVLPENRASAALFSGAGYRRISDQIYHRFPEGRP